MANADPQILTDRDYLAMLSENLDAGVSILDARMNYVFISNSVYRQLGITSAELKPGDPLSKCHDLMIEAGLLTSDYLKSAKMSAEDQIAKNQQAQSDDAQLVKLGNGQTHRFRRKALPNGLTLSISEDVSELVAKDELLRKALIMGNSGYWSLDATTRSYTLGETLQAYFGPETVAQIHRQGIISVVHPDDRAKFRTALMEAQKKGGRFEAMGRTVDVQGRERWSRSTGQIIRGADGKVQTIEAFVKDITKDRKQAFELERAKDEAIAANQAKSQFLANMSHEIRTPMNGILGMAELLAESDISHHQRDYINVINNSASALLTIINDILDFSKIEAGAFEIDPVPFNLKTALSDVTSLLRPTAQDKDLELIITYPTDCPTGFIGDAGRLRQVITNLVGNAVKFTDTGQVTIAVDIQKTRGRAICQIDVKDTGIGISPEKLSRIFDKFTQADGSTTRVYGGTGLGLTISKHIIEMMGGRMHVQSKLGEGSSFGFRVVLPLDPNAKAERFDSEVIAGARALIIDDIATNRTLFSEQMRGWNIRSDTAIDGVEALTKIKAAQLAGQPYDFLLLDYLMPGMNGQEFAQLLSSAPTVDVPPIIMLSSCDQPVTMTELAKIGVSNYLVKPVRERRLFDTIVRTLSNPTPRPAKPKPTFVPTPRDRQEILVAEDFPLNRDVVKLMLDDTMFKPIFAKHGQEAVDIYMADPHRFPVILMDVSMPVMDGYAATRAIRAQERTAKRAPIPVIALTGHAMTSDQKDCEDAGMTDYLSKPVRQSALLEKLESYTGMAINIRQAV